MGIGTEVAVGLAETVVNIASAVYMKQFPDAQPDELKTFTEGLKTSPQLNASLFGGGVSIAVILVAISSILGDLIPSKSSAQRYQFLLALERGYEDAKIANTQSEVNIAETMIATKSTNIWMQVFWAGFRPFTAWVCAVAFAISLLEHVGIALLGLIHIHINIDPINSTLMYQMLMGLLGLGTMRSVDKYLGTNKDQ